MDINDLENGMIAELRSGTKYLILCGKYDSSSSCSNNSRFSLIADSIFCSTGEYDSKLKNHKVSGADIVKLYKINTITSLKQLLDNPEKYCELVKVRDDTDWNKIPVDTKVYVKNSINDDWIPAYFNFYDESDSDNEFPYAVFNNGKTSFTAAPGSIRYYKYIKLAE